MGKNPLPIYVLSEILLIPVSMIMISGTNAVDWINTAFYQAIAPGPIGSLLFAISFMMICWLVAYILDKRNIYIRV
jgi:predicted acyltransferase